LEAVVAVVLLIAVVVVGAALVYLWISGYLSKSTSVAGEAVAVEELKVESASLDADGVVRLFIRNLGEAPVNISTIYVYPEGSLKPLCVKQGVKVVIPPGTLSAFGTALTCTTSPTLGINYEIKVVTAKGTERFYTITNLLPPGGGGDSGGGVACSFAASSGKRFGSPDGTPATGFNELNGWVGAWGPSGGGIRIALMPGITPPDSTGTGTSYTVELNGVQIGTLTVSGASVGMSIAGSMPGFMDVVRIWLEPGGHILYDNGPRPVVVLAPGTYQVYATLRVVPTYTVYGSSADLTLTCVGMPTATITLRVPDPEEWGLRADVYRWWGWPPPPVWPPFLGPAYAYKGTWSVGAIFYTWRNWPLGIIPSVSPYFCRDPRPEVAPKWVAYWLNPAATSWLTFAVRFTGRIYVPWSNIRVGVIHDEGAHLKLCDIDTGNSWWRVAGEALETADGTCTGAPNVYDIEVVWVQGGAGYYFVFLIGPDGGNEAYIPTIDGAWFCPNFNWASGIVPSVRCNASWSFVSASEGSVPYFVATNYTPGLTDGGGTPHP